jgi:hypothetical protein
MALRYSVQDVQFSRLFNHHTPKTINRFHKISSEFDDQIMSHSPISYLSNKTPIISIKI